MLVLHQMGTSYYLEDTQTGHFVHLTYPQYCTYADWYDGRVSSTDLWRRLWYYNRLQEPVLCPFCGKGTLTREVIRFLLLDDEKDDLHGLMFHGGTDD